MQAEPPFKFTVQYYGDSVATFTLQADEMGGTDLNLSDSGVLSEDRFEVVAGWVSVLMALKAAVDYGIDMRAHDPTRNWDNGFVEN